MTGRGEEKRGEDKREKGGWKRENEKGGEGRGKRGEER